jgi:hypothetical protein
VICERPKSAITGLAALDALLNDRAEFADGAAKIALVAR